MSSIVIHLENLREFSVVTPFFMEFPAVIVYHKSMDVTIGIPKRLGYLPLVVDVLRRTGLLDIIDQQKDARGFQFQRLAFAPADEIDRS